MIGAVFSFFTRVFDSVVDDEPTVFGFDRRRSAADISRLEPVSAFKYNIFRQFGKILSPISLAFGLREVFEIENLHLGENAVDHRKLAFNFFREENGVFFPEENVPTAKRFLISLEHEVTII